MKKRVNALFVLGVMIAINNSWAMDSNERYMYWLSDSSSVESTDDSDFNSIYEARSDNEAVKMIQIKGTNVLFALRENSNDRSLAVHWLAYEGRVDVLKGIFDYLEKTNQTKLLRKLLRLEGNFGDQMIHFLAGERSKSNTKEIDNFFARVLTLMQQYKIPLDSRDKLKNNALTYAIINNRTSMVKSLLKHKNIGIETAFQVTLNLAEDRFNAIIPSLKILIKETPEEILKNQVLYKSGVTKIYDNGITYYIPKYNKNLRYTIPQCLIDHDNANLLGHYDERIPLKKTALRRLLHYIQTFEKRGARKPKTKEWVEKKLNA